MAQMFTAFIFTFAAIGATLLVVRMLRDEAGRVLAILAGEELGHARALSSAPVRIRMRAWKAPAPRRALPLRAAA
jgi:hypothetical protein